MSLIPTSANNPCPVCGDQSGKCRHTDDPDFVLCMGPIGSERENRRGWVFLGMGKSELWGCWRAAHSIGRGKKQTPAQRRAAAREREKQERLQQERDVRAWQKRYGSIQTVGAAYQDLLDKTSLSLNHYNQLIRRGLSESDISRAGFRSVTRGLPVGDLDISGVRDGRWAATEGIFIPHRNIDGRILGGQIRADTGDAKYIWTKNPKTLVDDETLELPLAVVRRGDHRVILCEGGLKATITAARFARYAGEQVTVIGAAGGQFNKSLRQLKHALETLGCKHICFAPDAGAIANDSVRKRDARTISLLKDMGISSSILYWGQGFDKAMGDIDEITDLSQIQTISPQNYFGKTKTKDGLWSVLNKVLKNDPDENAGKTPSGETQSQTLSHETTAITLWDKRTARRNSTIKYHPGNLPMFEDWLASGSPSFEYGTGQRKSFWKEAISKGYKHILDGSEVGSGKSHDSGLFPKMLHDAPEIDRTIYLAADHNPDTTTIQKYYKDTPSRHDGLMIEKTALGFKQRRMTAAEKESGVAPTVEANCAYSAVFNEARDRGYDLPGGLKSPICQSCPHFEGCQTGGFLWEQSQINSFNALRGHPDQFQKARKNDVIFWEETGKIFQPLVEREISLSEIAETLLDLQTREPELYSLLRPIAANLYTMIRDRDGDRSSKFGKHHGEILEALPNTDDLSDHLWKEQSDTWIAPATEDVWEIPSTSQIIDLIIESAESDSEKWNVIKPGQTVEERLNAIQTLIPIWVKPALKSLAGETDRVNFSANFGRLHITEDRPNHRNLAHSARNNIYLDATIDVNDLARLIRVSQDQILIAREAHGDFENLEIRVLDGMGRIGAARGLALSRVRAIWAELKNRHASIGVIDWKRYLDQYPDTTAGAWMRDNRGSNSFRDLDALLIVGSAIPNLGAMAARWKTLTGMTVIPGRLTGAYGRWVKQMSLEETIQAIGRVRAQHTDQRKTIYLTGDNDHDLAAIADYFPGCRITREDAGNYSPEALTKGQARLRAIAQMTRDLIGEGAATLKNISQKLETSISNVSQTIKRKLGLQWSEFKSIISDICNGVMGDRNVMDGDYSYDQLEAVSALAEWFETSLVYCESSEVWDELKAIHSSVDSGVWGALWDWIDPQISLRLVTVLLRV